MKVIKVEARNNTCDDMSVYVTYENGDVYLYNAYKLSERCSVLKDRSFFLSRISIINNTLAWDCSTNGSKDDTICIDVAPESIQSSPRIL